MGFISNMTKNSIAEARQESQVIWNNIFGATDKETATRKPVSRPASDGGYYSRSVLTGPGSPSANASTKRLLQALRSMAPGGWTDNRWEQTGHFTGINYVAIDRIGRQLQRAEFKVFHRDRNHPDGKRPVMENEATPERNGPWDLVTLLEKPNPQDSFGKMVYRWNQQLRLTGIALTWMVPNHFPSHHPDPRMQKGTPFELYCIPTTIAIPQPAINPDYPDGYYRIQPVYPYGPFSSYPTPASAVGAPIPAQWMLRFLYPHPLLRYEGYSPLTAMRLEIDEFESIGRSRWYKMKRSINPSAVLNSTESNDTAQPMPETEIDRIHAEFENEFQGPENHGKLIVGTPGYQLDEFGRAPAEMEYQAGWKQLMDFILGGGHGITAPAAGMVEDSSYSTLFATLKQLYLLTLEPDCDDIAEYLTRHLAPFFGDDLIVEIKPKRIDDHDITFSKIDKGIAAKCLTKNQVLKLLELPPSPEPWGDDIAGDPSPNEQQQQQEQQMAAAGPQPGTAAEPGMEGVLPAEARKEPKEVAAERPAPGPLSEGALGPRKNLNGRRIKSLYERVTEAITNGH